MQTECFYLLCKAIHNPGLIQVVFQDVVLHCGDLGCGGGGLGQDLVVEILAIQWSRKVYRGAGFCVYVVYERVNAGNRAAYSCHRLRLSFPVS